MSTRLKILAAMTALAIGGCAIIRYLGLEPRPPRIFSHKTHVTDQGQACKSCHRPDSAEAKYEMPAVKTCMKCHEGSPIAEKIAARYGDQPQWSIVTALPEETIFSHRTHIEKKVECGECHVGIETSASIGDDARIMMDACASCHTRKGKADECEACHRDVRRDRPPRSHMPNWKYEHGPVTKAGNLRLTENRCSLCHTDAACTKCHQDEPPRDHTNFWRLEGHAVAVAIDRSGCQTCHRPDFCDRCHRDTEPRSHVASWGSPSNRHCQSCHVPPTAAGSCVTCHPTGFSHPTAPPKPAGLPHSAATDCRTCHSGLSHPDNGDNCNYCHK